MSSLCLLRRTSPLPSSSSSSSPPYRCLRRHSRRRSRQALSQIHFYEQNPLEYDKMLNEPILAHGQETLEKYFSWDETVGNGRLKSRIRQMVGL